MRVKDGNKGLPHRKSVELGNWYNVIYTFKTPAGGYRSDPTGN